MSPTERVTVTLSSDLVQGIDRFERNRSRFIAEAVRRELECRRRQELLRSLQDPHPEIADLAEAGFADWGEHLPPDDEELVDLAAGTPVNWVEGEGWVERPR